MSNPKQNVETRPTLQRDPHGRWQSHTRAEFFNFKNNNKQGTWHAIGDDTKNIGKIHGKCKITVMESIACEIFTVLTFFPTSPRCIHNVRKISVSFVTGLNWIEQPCCFNGKCRVESSANNEAQNICFENMFFLT